MAKKKRGGETMGIMATFTPPSPKERIRMAAESAARTAMEEHPKMAKVRDEITHSIEVAIKRALLGRRRGNTE